MRRLLGHLPIILPLLPSAYGICECGYRVRSTGEYFTNLLVSNFSTLPAATSLNQRSPAFSQDWTVQSWAAPASDINPNARTNGEDNVWLDGDALVFRQRGLSSEEQNGGNVSVAAIVSKRHDFLHMSARATFEVDAGQYPNRGSVAGFFWYNVRV